MPEDIAYSEVERWLEELPETFVRNVETVPDGSVDFNFLVETPRLSVHVKREQREGPLVIAADLALEDDALEAVREHHAQFVKEVDAVLTNAPGITSYTDERGNPAPDDEFTTVSLRHWIYPDGATQHEVSNAVIDVITAASYVRDTANRIVDEPSRL